MTIKVAVVSTVLMGLCFLVFSPTIGYEFVNWDDDIYVYDNARIRSSTIDDVLWWFSNTYYYSYIPVTMLSHSLDYFLWGLSARGHHLSSVLLHSANTVMIFLLGMMLARIRGSRREPGTRSDEWAVILGMSGAALLFAVHPLRVESVAWVSDRKDLLCTFFLISSTMLYLHSSYGSAGQRGRLQPFLSFVLFVFALLSKSAAIGFPLVLLGMDWYLLSSDEWRQQWKRLVASKLWFALASVAVSLVLLTIDSGGKRAYAVEQLDGVEPALFTLYSFAFYVFKTFVPTGLAPIYPSVEFGPMLLGALVTVGTTIGTIMLARKGRKIYVLCWLAYMTFLFPTVVGLSSGMQAQADRFSYLPSIALFLLGAGGLVNLLRRGSAFGRLLIPIATLVVVAGLATMTVRQNSYWESSESLWRYVVEQFPPSRDYVDAYVNLGAVYAARMDLPDAERVLIHAVQLDSTNADVFYNLGHVLYLRGEWEQAVSCFEKSTRIDTGYAKGYFNFAVISSQLGRDSIAIPAMRRAAMLGSKEALDALHQAGIHPVEGGGTIPVE